ncbi:unnamed protein product [Linum tenue]|uniref:Uncharacterized protein n=1 Tax=Linum tenue TaxID=586396 RepID=A0AAV0NMG8_9ROSI|nr:unnamed protein product [Linum tenue]
MEGEGSLEFQEWEVHSYTEAIVVRSPVLEENPRSFEEIESDEIEAKEVYGSEFDQLVSELLSCKAKSESCLEENVKSRQLGFEEIEQKVGKEKDMTKFWSGSGGDGLVLGSEVMSDEATRGGNAPWRRTRVLLKMGMGNQMAVMRGRSIQWSRGKFPLSC